MATCPVVDDCAIYRQIFLQEISKQEKFYKQIGTYLTRVFYFKLLLQGSNWFTKWTKCNISK